MASVRESRPAAANDDKPELPRFTGRARPTAPQRAWLERGLDQPGGKLPLFDRNGQRINPRTIRACLARGWAERWFANPTKPGWLVCKLTDKGRDALFKD